MKWTDAQRDAIAIDDADLLVAADAGAGKTGVLTERVVRKVAAGQCSVTELLVVTFTEAAAAEMRERIARKLADALDDARNAGDAEQADRLARQIVLLDAGQVSTLHSFASQLLHEHFHHLGLDPAFEVLGEEEAPLLRSEMLDELLEEYYGDQDATGRRFAELLEFCDSGRGDDNLRAMILKLSAKVNSLPEPDDWWRRAGEALSSAGDRLADGPWARPLRRLLEIEFEAALARLTQARAIAAAADSELVKPAYHDNLTALVDHVESLAKALKDRDFWGRVGELLADYPIKRMTGLPSALAEGDRLKALVKQVRDALRRLGAMTARDEGDVLDDLSAVAPLASLVGDLARAFDRRYARAKAARGALDFADLERYAYELLTRHEAVRTAVAGQFREVLVDEYQDISPIQNAILHAVAFGRSEAAPSGEATLFDEVEQTPAAAGTRLFMVGDLKQSIYRFRLAEPDIFAAAIAEHESGRAGKLVHLAENFRSRRSVIDAVNAMFEALMQPARTLISDAGGPVYDESTRMQFAAPPYQRDDAPADAAVELHLSAAGVEAEPSAEGDDAEEQSPAAEDELVRLQRQATQARLVGLRLKALLGRDGGEPAIIWDKDAERFRPARPRDVAILLRSASNIAPIYVEQLTAMGLPVHAAAPGGYFQAVEINDVRSLLAVLDNPRQDIPLAAVLRSPLMAVTEDGGRGRALSADELAAIRLADGEGQFFDALLAAVHGEATDATLRERLQRLLDELDRWRTMARRRPLSELLADVYRRTGYLDYVAGLGGGAARRANLLDLARRARQFDSFARQGLARFMRFLDELEAAGEDLGTPGAVSEADDVIRIITVHRSKGLEFPIVVLADLEHQFNLSDSAGDVLFHRELLLGLRRLDPARRLRYPTLSHLLIAEQLRLESVLEEIRLLYVAMTRARDRLLMFGSAWNLDRSLASWQTPLGADDLSRARCPLDWIAPTVLSAPAAEPLRAALSRPRDAGDLLAADCGSFAVHVYAEPCLRRLLGETVGGDSRGRRPKWTDAAARGEKLAADKLTAAQSAVRDALAERLTFQYAFASLTDQPAKRSVTELKRLFDTRSEPDESPATAAPTFEPRPMDSTPPWEQGPGADPLRRGIATHALLQRLDLAADLDDPRQVADQMAAMSSAGLLDPHTPALVDVDALADFFGGEVGRLLRARREAAHREWTFSLKLDVNEILSAAGEPALADPAPRDVVLVQGIIDVLLELEDGTLAVLDFKTDAVRGERQVAERAAGYRPQIDLYARAAETILGRPVSRRLLYFLAPRKLVELDAPSAT